MKIAIVTDSSSGINTIEGFSDLYHVPLMITRSDGTQIRDDNNLSKDEFYNIFENEILKTSSSAPKDMLEMWTNLLKDYDQIIVPLLSKGLSGQYNIFKKFSEEEEYKGKVHVVDTDGVSIILEHQILSIIDKIKEGKSCEEIVEEIESTKNSHECFIIMKSMKTLVRGGRITKAAAALAKILKIIPILRFNGMIDKETKTRTFKKAIHKAIELILKKYPTIKKIDLSYSRSNDETFEEVHKVIESFGLEVNLKSELPNVITCHTGPETFAIAGWGQDEEAK